ncbi:DUF3822 family protein [Flavobacterium sp. CYK-55]|uniref:DUF3822 family protein n=1 Tax=Flavobacterium sp. CYK-55 TaxID=2835529 RepID=UPI001BCA73E2|nr:DUF3822 family protein [Flavobacterium sp. CYK-55]MBS7786581.1 DUF3822 family protein [Flavobacterium sp. CYK-55]
MLVNAANITEKKYRKLTLLLTEHGLEMSVTDTLNNQILSFDVVSFDASAPAEQQLLDALQNHASLRDLYDEVGVVQQNNLSTFVPDALLDESQLGAYLQYNNKVFAHDDFRTDTLNNYSIHHVYVAQSRWLHVLEEHFKIISAKHAHSVLVGRLLDLSKNVDDKRMFVHMAPGHFEIIIVQNQHLLLFNSFEYKTPEDLIYYLLFTAEQLNLNPESFRLEFLGKISEDDAFYKIAYKYIRNVSLFDPEDARINNDFSAQDNREHFILFQS